MVYLPFRLVYFVCADTTAVCCRETLRRNSVGTVFPASPELDQKWLNLNLRCSASGDIRTICIFFFGTRRLFKIAFFRPGI